MSKMEVFVPFTDTRDEMIAYFNDQNVLRLSEPSVTEGVDRDSDVSVFQNVAAEFAQDFMDRHADVPMGVLNEDPFMGEFYSNGNVIGWEFEFYAYEVDFGDDDYLYDSDY